MNLLLHKTYFTNVQLQSTNQISFSINYWNHIFSNQYKIQKLNRGGPRNVKSMPLVSVAKDFSFHLFLQVRGWEMPSLPQPWINYWNLIAQNITGQSYYFSEHWVWVRCAETRRNECSGTRSLLGGVGYRDQSVRWCRQTTLRRILCNGRSLNEIGDCHNLVSLNTEVHFSLIAFSLSFVDSVLFWSSRIPSLDWGNSRVFKTRWTWNVHSSGMILSHILVPH